MTNNNKTTSVIDKFKDIEKQGNVVCIKNQEKNRIDVYLRTDKEPSSELEGLNFKMEGIWQELCADFENYWVDWSIYCVKHNKKVICDVNRGLYCPICRQEKRREGKNGSSEILRL